MENLLGTWRQTSHQAIINGLLCRIDPIDEVIWEFAPKGIMTQSTSIEGIHCVNRVLYYPDQGILMVRPNSSDKHTIYSMQFYSDGTLFLRTHNRTGDRIRLVRNEELGIRSEELGGSHITWKGRGGNDGASGEGWC